MTMLPASPQAGAGIRPGQRGHCTGVLFAGYNAQLTYDGTGINVLSGEESPLGTPTMGINMKRPDQLQRS